MGYATLVARLARPLMLRAERELSYLLALVGRYYTPLALLVLFITGAAFIFATGYLFRYANWNYWLWKSRAVTRTLCYGAILVTLKLLLGVI